MRRSRPRTTNEREKRLPANYGGATPEEIALAVLRYRPGKKNKPRPKPKPRRKAGGRPE